MGKYPKVITEEILKNQSHISTDEIMNDIADTKREIDSLVKQVEGYRLIAEANIGTHEGKMASFRQSGSTFQAAERVEFVEFLEKLITARKEHRDGQTNS